MPITYTVSADAAGQRLDKYLVKLFPGVPKSHLFKMVRTKKVRVNHKRAQVGQLLAEGDVVTVRGATERLVGPTPEKPAARAPTRKPELAILYRDEDLLAVNKPAGMAIHPGSGIEGGTLVDLARAWLGGEPAPGEFRPSPAHRLDRGTSGVVLVARTRKAMVELTRRFTRGETQKQYLALVKGQMPRARGTIDLPLAEHQQTARSRAARGVNLQPAVTHWTVVAQSPACSLLSVEIETGRTHQIRRHLAAIGHPVAGDDRYGDFAFNRRAKADWGLRRLFLHAARLEVPHPRTGKPLVVEAPLPPELLSALARAGLPPPG